MLFWIFLIQQTLIYVFNIGFMDTDQVDVQKLLQAFGLIYNSDPDSQKGGIFKLLETYRLEVSVGIAATFLVFSSIF